jgi:NACHT domain
LGNNFSAGGNNIFNINAGPSTETIEAIRCKRSLFTTDPVDDRAAYISFKDEIITATFTWITKSQPYKSWVDRSTGSGILWISGGPGTGKSMLSVFLTQELESVETGKALVLYYFCEGRDPKRNSPVHLLRALIYTLVQERPSLMKHLLPDYQVRQESLFGPDAIEPLWRILMKMIEDPDTGDVYCIIDGLDECAKTSLTHLEHILKKFKGFYNGHLGRRSDADSVSSKFGQLSLSSGTGRLESGPATGKAPNLARPVFKTALISREDPECLYRELSAFQRLRLGKLAETGIAGQASAPFNKMNPPVDGAMQMSLNGNVASQSVTQGQTMISAAEDTPITGYSESLSIQRSQTDQPTVQGGSVPYVRYQYRAL